MESENKQIIREFKSKYRDFPKIPITKHWKDHPLETEENEILNKLTKGKQITRTEEEIIKSGIEFTIKLIYKLNTFDFSNFKQDDILDFKDYFFNSFDNSLFVRKDYFIERVFRLVKNESILGSKDRICNKKHLSYPSVEIVNRINKYNRANTPNYNIFYAANSIDSALKELKPQKGDIVTVGVWDFRHEGNPLRSYPVFYNPLAIELNTDLKQDFTAQQNMKRYFHPLLMAYTDLTFGFIASEFAKPVKKHLNYLISALISEDILVTSNYDSFPDGNDYECIEYPAVGNKYSNSNLAILPNVVDGRFKLIRVIEFEVAKTFYNKIIKNYRDGYINYVDYKNLEFTDDITDKGEINW